MHERTLRHLPGWNAWQTICTCGWESSPWPSRPEAIREHTLTH